MKCEEIARLIDPYLDGELDVASCVEVEEHLAECPACREKLESRQGLATLVAEEAPRYTASPFLATRIRAALRAEEPAADKVPWWRAWSTPNIFAAAILGAVVVAIFAVATFFPTHSTQIAQEGISDHVRSLLANHLMDVASTDQHTVKPWFTGKLDFAPQVIDLKAQEYPLIGGRLDRLDGHTVAAVVYQRRKHYINLFVWPADRDSLNETYEKDGYHVFGWTRNGMNYLAVSEIGTDELRDFTEMIKNQIVPPLE